MEKNSSFKINRIKKNKKRNPNQKQKFKDNKNSNNSKNNPKKRNNSQNNRQFLKKIEWENDMYKLLTLIILMNFLT